MIDNPQVVMTNFFSIIISLTVHEYAHAFVANYMGDPTPARYGRLNLNPITIIKAHPFSAFVLPLIGSTQGWLIAMASTPVNPHLVERKYSLRQAEFWIAVAGPLSNVILAGIFALIYSTLVFMGASKSIDIETFKPLIHLTETLVTTNIFLAIFNMIPIPPFDGYTVLSNTLPRAMSDIPKYMEQYGNMILLFILIFGGRVLSPIIYKITNFFFMLSYQIVGLFF